MVLPQVPETWETFNRQVLKRVPTICRIYVAMATVAHEAAASDHTTFILSCSSLFSALLLKHVLPIAEILSSSGGRKQVFGSGAADFDHPTWPFRPREEDTRSKSHANPVWFKAAAS